jgi:N-acetylglucosaminyldiphosphoundecaprenol N-acetyl-beta-D-mannosaminyltransferase
MVVLQLPYHLLPGFGVRCLAFTDEKQVLSLLSEILVNQSGGYSVAINAEKLYRQSSDQRLATVLQNATMPVADGSGAVIALKWLCGKDSIKVDLPRLLLEALNSLRETVLVYGTTEENNLKACHKIAAVYPGVRIAGRIHGYAPLPEVVALMERVQPKSMLVALGSPKQEQFIQEMSEKFPSIFFVGCGGALNILAGQQTRAPAFFINNHLEWLYRLWLEPSRWRRQLVLPKFFLKLCLLKLGLVRR